MHVRDTDPEELMQTVNELSQAGGWRLIVVTQYSPFNAMERAEYTAFLERS
jgi:hypothetical protein